MSDPLLEAVRALRETTTGKEAAVGRYTRARVLAAVRTQKRRRVVHVAFGVPLAAILIGSGAWAASGQTLPLFIQRVSAVLGLRESSGIPAVASNPRRLAPRSLPTGLTSVGSSPDVEATSSEPLGPGEAASSEPIGTSDAAIANDPSLAKDIGVSSASSKSQESTVLRRDTESTRASQQRDSRVTEQELALYENAHRAHFIAKEVGRALVAWNDYLRQFPKGRFSVEARYNRALCLVRLGRNGEARQALTPFARGAFGGYRQTEAAALLENLSEPEP